MAFLVEYEQQKRGSAGFPAELYHVDSSHPRYAMPFHWHIECEFIIIQQGSLRLLLDGEAVELCPGWAAFIPGGMVHGCCPQGDGAVYECVVLELEHFLCGPAGNTFFHHELGGGANVRNRFSEDSGAGQLILQLFSELHRKELGYGMVTTGLLWEFMGMALREDPVLPQDSQRSRSLERTRQIKQALQMIRSDYSQPLTLQDLSAEANMSPKHFCRVFREFTGHTPIDYLNRYRIDRAAEQIYATTESVTEIALHCGFNDPGYFSRTFRRYRGISPLQFRSEIHSVPSPPIRRSAEGAGSNRNT